jgi:transcriptional regulator with XRE-family HTH domain
MARDEIPESAADMLRAKIRDSKLSMREIARRANVDVGQLSRFVGGQRMLLLSTAEDVAGALGCRLRVVRRVKQAGRKGKV